MPSSTKITDVTGALNAKADWNLVYSGQQALPPGNAE